MKKIYYLMFFAIANLAISQTLTDAANKPIVGDSYAGNNVTGTVNNSATGTGATFSNPSLTAGAAITSSYSAPSASEITTFPGSNLKLNDGSGNLIFYKSSSNKLEITGLTNTSGTFNFISDNATYLTFPTSFGYANSDNAKGTFTSTAASGLFKGTINATADASGTLLIGTNTYTNVLRVKIVQNYNLYQSTDTFYLFSIGNFTTTTYLYYDSTHKFPLLSDNTGTISVPLLSINQTDTAAIAQGFVFLGSKELAPKNTFSVYPNPVNDVLKFKGLSKKDQLVKIYSIDGKLVQENKINSNEVNVSQLSSGNYFITVSGDENTNTTVKMIKK